MDWKPAAVIRDRELLRALHLEWVECVLCGSTGWDSQNSEIGLSLHHVLKHPRDDVRGNLVMLCGHGTAGCHGAVEAHDYDVLEDLGQYLVWQRPDTISHLVWRLGGAQAANEWLQRTLRVSSPTLAAFLVVERAERGLAGPFSLSGGDV